ncbi:DnaJ domain [Macleaya cordata]|uniref:DnaJ domain n=1 Tax=Macleaya cordata TaxID=56857 RepID=A0A200R430_MACCD|nr:DnaJ domain [Macleaya cordata]
MECNRDEATRAKEIAERKFSSRDIAGAKKFALKAQNLYPNLEGLSQMLATLDVYLSADNKMGGEADWYGILGVSPSSDDETVKKQYRKLALMLHPDKNKSIGADGAFKLISEAWSLLSDKTKRVAYDQKRFSRTSQQRVPTTSGGPSVPAANGFTNSTSSSVRSHKSTTHTGSTTAPSPPSTSKSNTFWTACNRCKMQYEYLRVYQNHTLLCPNCHEPFLAVETANPPSNGSNSSTSRSFSQQRQNSNHHTTKKNTYASGRSTADSPNIGPAQVGGHGSFNHTSFQWGPAAGVGNAAASANIAQQACEKAKREHEEAQAAARRQEAVRKKHPVSKRPTSGFCAPGSSPEGEGPVKRTKVSDYGGGNYHGGNVANQMASGSGSGNSSGSASGFKQGGLETGRVNGFSVPNRSNSTRDLSQTELRNMLAEKARREIRKKLSEWSLSTRAKASEKESKKQKGKETSVPNGDENNKKKSGVLNSKKVVQDRQASLNISGVDSVGEIHEPLSINVPDSDFHDFDKDRSERSFGDNQVWAAYDNDDGMPRYYAMIQRVVSLNPFKMRISWLNSKTNSELGPVDWVGSGFSKTCGEFRVGRYEINKSLNSFSHRVTWTKGARGVVRIFPMKGDVWAVYRNWSPDWNESTPDEVIHKYEMVEVLDDYNEEQGVTVTPLVKVTGFKTVFHRHLDPGEARRIPREEMFRFSHQVPSYLLTGQEAQNAPKGCHELDPAATPVELLQVITEAKEEETEDCAEEQMRKEAKGEVVENAKKQIEIEPREEDCAEEQMRKEAKGEVVENAKKQIEIEPREEDIAESAEEKKPT